MKSERNEKQRKHEAQNDGHREHEQSHVLQCLKIPFVEGFLIQQLFAVFDRHKVRREIGCKIRLHIHVQLCSSGSESL